MSIVSSENVPHCVNSVRMEVASELDYEEVVFCWKVRAFSPIRFDEEELQSPVLIGGPRSKHSWKLQWKRPSGSSAYHNTQVVLVQTCSLQQEVRASARITYKKPSESLPQTSYFKAVKAGEIVSANYAFVSSTDLYNPNNGYIVDGAVTVYCSLLIQLGTKQSLISKITLPALNSATGTYFGQSSPRERKGVVAHIRALLDSGEFADVQLVTPTKTISAHRNILAARSPVFAAMFRANMLEAQHNSVKIPDFELQVVEAMLEFIYTGQVNEAVFTEIAMDLFRIADKYELLDLKADCEEVLFSNVKIENAADVLMVACLHNAVALKTATMDFIVGNKKKVIETESFKKAASNPEILFELFSI